MITIPTSERYHDNFQGGTSGEGPCVVCGKDQRPGPRLRYLHVHYGGDTAILPEEEAEADRACPGGDLGEQPIGADCLARHPELLPYVVARPQRGVAAAVAAGEVAWRGTDRYGRAVRVELRREGAGDRLCRPMALFAVGEREVGVFLTAGAITPRHAALRVERFVARLVSGESVLAAAEGAGG